MSRIIQDERGQGTVEAVFVIPVMFLLMLMLLQPGIILYDYIVMNNAAEEACRLLATTDAGSDQGTASSVDFVLNRLSAVPQHECFHAHKNGCSWAVQVEEGEESGTAVVWIDNDLRPLPLLDVALKLLGMTDGSGYLHLTVGRASVEQPSWPFFSEPGGPSGWAGAWC